MNSGLRASLLVSACLLGLTIVSYGQPAQRPPQDPAAPAAPSAGRAQRAPRPPVSEYPKAAEFPKEDRAAVGEFLAQARKIAGGDLFSDMAHRCIFTSVYRERVNGIQYRGIMEPTKLFDNLYSVGQIAVSSHALVTSQGIVLFDSLNNEDEARNIIVPNLIKLGLDPRNIKFVVITHEHGDHYGGARYLQKTFGAKIIASKIAWDAMAPSVTQSGAFAGTPPPDRDVEIATDQIMKVGSTDLQFYLTPGHTDGVLSTIFRVTDNGQQHTVGYFGGTGGGGGEKNLRNHITSLERWRKITAAAGVDVLVANHPLHDRGIENNYMLRYSVTGNANPYILGKSMYDRYFQVQELCAKVQLGRLGLRPQ